MNRAQAAQLTALAGLASLDEPVRRRLYEYVRQQDQPVSREAAAAAAGIRGTRRYPGWRRARLVLWSSRQHAGEALIDNRTA